VGASWRPARPGGTTNANEPPTASLGHLVEQVVAGLRPWSDRHAVAVAVRAPAPVEAEVDPLRLEQVLINLLDNAIKFSPDGGPIDVVLDGVPDAGPAGPGRGVVELSVRDRGLGIPPERRGQIFERFYQAHDDAYRSGMGLGLYVSRPIVGLHGGEIRAEFPADGGTRFVVRLPLGRP
jgi:two-component system phosphate regulon sensor histidine kinase PhoR